jgi:hypothetical protein
MLAEEVITPPTAYSAALASAPASGTSITYTPTQGAIGPVSDSLKYTATNSSGTSYPALVSITIAPAAGNVLFSELGSGGSGSPNTYSFAIPANAPPYVYVYLYGGGGGAKKHGGGGGAYAEKHFAVTPGTTILYGTIASAGLGFLTTTPSPPTCGGISTMASSTNSSIKHPSRGRFAGYDSRRCRRRDQRRRHQYHRPSGRHWRDG